MKKQERRGRKPRKPEESNLPWGRPPSRQEDVHHADKIKAFRRALGLPETLKTFRAIAGELTRRSGVIITPGTLYRYIVDGKAPRKNPVRLGLGLPKARLVLANPPRRWRDLPLSELRRAIENRVEYKP